jgi:hypothetical protein
MYEEEKFFFTVTQIHLDMGLIAIRSLVREKIFFVPLSYIFIIIIQPFQF